MCWQEQSVLSDACYNVKTLKFGVLDASSVHCVHVTVNMDTGQSAAHMKAFKNSINNLQMKMKNNML